MKREFSKEFKRDAVSLVVDQGYSRVEAASSLDIHPALLSRWVREHTEDGGEVIPPFLTEAKSRGLGS